MISSLSIDPYFGEKQLDFSKKHQLSFLVDASADASEDSGLFSEVREERRKLVILNAQNEMLLVEKESSLKSGVPPFKKWNERAISYLDDCEDKLKLVENLPIQEKFDRIGSYIENKFKPLGNFNRYLNENGKGHWFKQLTTFLVKLPVKSIANVIKLLYQIISKISYAIIHPLHAPIQVAKLIVQLLHELEKPENWSKMGIGTIGASLGNALVSGNPLSIIGIGIGSALLMSGLMVGTLKALIKAEKGNGLESMKNHLMMQIKELPEAMLTGFLMGLLMGGIQRFFQLHQKNALKVVDQNTAKQWVDKFQGRYDLPTPNKIQYSGAERVEVSWSSDRFAEVLSKRPYLSKFTKIIFETDASHHLTNFENMTLTQYSSLASGVTTES